jgi:hypothetical protein
MPASKKKKPALRRVWSIDPVTRVKESTTKYSRPGAKQEIRKVVEEE